MRLKKEIELRKLILRYYNFIKITDQLIFKGIFILQIFDNTIRDILLERLISLEKYFDTDVLFFYGGMQTGLDKNFRDAIEKLKECDLQTNRLVIIINTKRRKLMTVVERVNREVSDNLTVRNTDQEFIKFSEFYAQAKQLGIVVKQEYTIPPLDTIGLRLYQTIERVKC